MSSIPPSPEQYIGGRPLRIVRAPLARFCLIILPLGRSEMIMSFSERNARPKGTVILSATISISNFPSLLSSTHDPDGLQELRIANKRITQDNPAGERYAEVVAIT